MSKNKGFYDTLRVRSEALARKSGAEYVLPEHVLLALALERDFEKFCPLGAEPAAIELETREYLRENEGRRKREAVVFTKDYDRVFATAAKLISEKCGETEAFFRALLADEESRACWILEENGVTLEKLLQPVECARRRIYDLRRESKRKEGGEEKSPSGAQVVRQAEGILRIVDRLSEMAGKELGEDKSREKKPSAAEGSEWADGDDEIDRGDDYDPKSADNSVPYIEDLTSKARRGDVLPMVGRERQLRRLAQILHRKDCPNPVVVGPSGVGKTCLVEELARRIATGSAPGRLKRARILSLDVSGLVAGGNYVGDLEKRIREVVQNMKADDILFLDDLRFAASSGGGSSSGNVRDSGVLAVLARNLSNTRKGFRVRVAATCTDADYRRFGEDGGGLPIRFTRVDLPEPSADETKKIVEFRKTVYAGFHEMLFPEAVVDKAIELCGRYLTERRFPEKVLAVLDELGSRHSAGLLPDCEATVSDVEALVAEMANVPAICRPESARERLRTLDSDIGKELYGQDEAVSKVVRHIRMAKAGLGSPQKPVGVFALAGPTGCGKTELAKQVARCLGCAFLRYDMSEYAEKGSQSKLVGTSPGYIGFEQEGGLTDAVAKSPECVILFDEIEKACPEVHNLLLQAMDDGRLTDGKNRVVSFHDAVIFMTSNVGSRAAEDAGKTVGFAPESQEEEILDDELKRTFPPEFRNRFTALLRFRQTDRKTLLGIVDKEVRRINANLAERGVCVELSDEVRSFLADCAERENMGGRPVGRLVDLHVAEPLSELLLFGDENALPSVVRFGMKGGKPAALIDSHSSEGTKPIAEKEKCRHGKQRTESRKAGRG